MEKGLVSVVIPTYGRADMLDRAINSVLKQTYENIEIIIVNDNDITSPQYCETLEVLSKYNLNTKVKIISDGKNVGGSLARNKGITAGKGEYVTFLDDDDYYYPDKIKKQLEFLVAHDVDVCVCNMDILKNGKIIKDNRSVAIANTLAEFIVYGNCYTPMIFLKKNVLLNVDMFTDTPKFQDHILMLKILEKNFKVKNLNEFLFVHNDHLGARITSNENTSLGFLIRNKIEKRNLNILNHQMMKKYKFNNLVLRSYFVIDNEEKLSKFKNYILMFKYITNIEDIIILFKIFVKAIFNK